MTENGQRSDPPTIKQGVPQGSVLRPILFLLFVKHTRLQPSRSSIDIFADDTREEQLVRAKERRKRKSEEERRGGKKQWLHS